jgi:mono/diheme cytochrome c family protein
MKWVLFAMVFLFLACEKKEIPLSSHPGAQIYHGVTRMDVRCARCHGDIGEGSSRAPALVTDGHTLPKPEFVKTVLQGRDRMPSFTSVLSDKEIESISDWLEEVHKNAVAGGSR